MDGFMGGLMDGLMDGFMDSFMGGDFMDGFSAPHFVMVSSKETYFCTTKPKIEQGRPSY
jgi:hypothetical protein